MAAGFKLILIAALAGALPCGCWRSAGGAGDAPDGGDTDTWGGITDPDTGGPWHYEWISADVPTDDDLSGVYGFSSSDVFAVGEGGAILRFDGTSWSVMEYPVDLPVSDLGGVWGSSPTDVFAVGSDGMIVHYDGASWATMSSPISENLHDVCGRSPGEAFAVGDGGTLLVYAGAVWGAVDTGIDRDLFAAWCGPGAAVYAAGHANDAFGSSVLLRYDVALAEIAHPVADFLYALGGVAPDAVYIGAGRDDEEAGLLFEISRSTGGGPFEPVAAGSSLLVDAWAVGEGELWAVGLVGDPPRGVIHHVADLSLDEPVIFADLPALRGVWRDPEDPQGVVFAVGDDGTILHGVPTQAY